MTDETMKNLIQEDDASRYLRGLSDKERRPQYVRNKLPKSPKTFSSEERAVARAIFTPEPDSEDNPK